MIIVIIIVITKITKIKPYDHKGGEFHRLPAQVQRHPPRVSQPNSHYYFHCFTVTITTIPITIDIFPSLYFFCHSSHSHQLLLSLSMHMYTISNKYMHTINNIYMYTICPVNGNGEGGGHRRILSISSILPSSANAASAPYRRCLSAQVKHHRPRVPCTIPHALLHPAQQRERRRLRPRHRLSTRLRVNAPRSRSRDPRRGVSLVLSHCSHQQLRPFMH